MRSSAFTGCVFQSGSITSSLSWRTKCYLDGHQVTKLPFLRNSPTGQTRRPIFTHDGSNDADSLKDVPFWEFFTLLPISGVKKQFWSVNRRFQAKLAKSKNVHIIKTTASIPTKFCTVIKTTKCPSWVVADGRHLGKIEKLLYLSRGLSDFDEIWHADEVRPFRPLKI